MYLGTFNTKEDAELVVDRYFFNLSKDNYFRLTHKDKFECPEAIECSWCNEEKLIGEFSIPLLLDFKNICNTCYSNRQSRRYVKELINGYTQKDLKSRDFKSYISYELIKIRSRCKREGKDYDLSTEKVYDILVKQQFLCAISNLPLSHQTSTLMSCSIDRLDPEKGYLLNNIQITSYAINIMKNRLKLEEFFSLCHAVSKSQPFTQEVDLYQERYLMGTKKTSHIKDCLETWCDSEELLSQYRE